MGFHLFWKGFIEHIYGGAWVMEGFAIGDVFYDIHYQSTMMTDIGV